MLWGIKPYAGFSTCPGELQMIGEGPDSTSGSRVCVSSLPLLSRVTESEQHLHLRANDGQTFLAPLGASG